MMINNAKQIVLQKFPKAVCKMKWGTGYCVELKSETKDFNNNTITKIQTKSHNPQQAWEDVCFELRLIGPA